MPFLQSHEVLLLQIQVLLHPVPVISDIVLKLHFLVLLKSEQAFLQIDRPV